jgi:hypothetical protein
MEPGAPPVLVIEKSCYEFGRTLTATFDNISGTGVWIGMYHKKDVSNFRELPSFETNLLIDWILSCGTRDDCDEWPTQGTIKWKGLFFDDGEYVLAVSGPGGSNRGQAAASFSIGC